MMVPKPTPEKPMEAWVEAYRVKKGTADVQDPKTEGGGGEVPC